MTWPWQGGESSVLRHQCDKDDGFTSGAVNWFQMILVWMKKRTFGLAEYNIYGPLFQDCTQMVLVLDCQFHYCKMQRCIAQSQQLWIGHSWSKPDSCIISVRLFSSLVLLADRHHRNHQQLTDHGPCVFLFPTMILFRRPLAWGGRFNNFRHSCMLTLAQLLVLVVQSILLMIQQHSQQACCCYPCLYHFKSRGQKLLLFFLLACTG